MEDIFGFIVVVIGIVASIISSANKKKQQARTPYPPASAASVSPQAAPADQQRPMSAAPLFREGPLTTAQPTVHTHLAPDCDTHDKSGSLNYRSLEGKDPCHVQQLSSVREALPEPDAPAVAGLQLDWTGENLVKAFVMQEVLIRPSQRRARQ